MYLEWVVAEHHRLHIVEEWPEGPQKQAVLASIHSKLESLHRVRRDLALPECMVCLSRKVAICVTRDADLFQKETSYTEHAA
jgi:hypothetical protein